MNLKERINCNKKFTKKSIILFAIMFIGLGFAALSATLGINGLARVGHISFDVHFENVSINPESMEAEKDATINPIDNTQIDFVLLLTKPGEYYEFETDIVNSGTLDAYLSNIEVFGLDEETEKYLDIDCRYVNGSLIKINDLLLSGSTKRIRVSVEFLYDITLEDLSSEGTEKEFGLRLTYTQENRLKRENLYSKVASFSDGIDNEASKFVLNSEGIDFGSSPSDFNGKGVYLRAGSENDEYPIYYYRGAVEDNHVLFGGFCWKIVRTTELGGTKLIYDGEPDENNQCNNTGEDTQIGISYFDEGDRLSKGAALEAGGYMYGTKYEYITFDDTEYVYGSDVEYNNGEYTLKYILSGTAKNIKNKHYTCKTTSTICETVYYVYDTFWYDAHAIALNNGEKLDDIINEAFDNVNDSTIKKQIDAWYTRNISGQENKLEDAVWCNDRSIISGGYLKEGDVTASAYYRGYEKWYSTTKSELKDVEACPNKNDRFTKDNTNGNGALTYPVGLLTADEAIAAGLNEYIPSDNTYSKNSYLCTGKGYWLLTPAIVGRTVDSPYVFSISEDAELVSWYGYNPPGIRPAIVLNHDAELLKGDGTAINPYVVE